MPGKSTMTIPATRTIRLRIAASTNQGKLATPNTTTAAWDQAVSFYTTIFLEYPRVFEARTTREVRSGPDAGKTKEVVGTEKDRLTWVESGRYRRQRTPPSLPSATWRRSLLGVPPTCSVLPLLQHPGPCRRTGGTFGVGRKQTPKHRGRKPKPPQPHSHMTAYGGMAKVHLGDDRDGFIRLKVKTGVGWQWLNYHVQAPPCLDAMLRESAERRARIAIVRAEKQRMAAERPEGKCRPGAQGSATHARALGGRVSNRDPEA